MRAAPAHPAARPGYRYPLDTCPCQFISGEIARTKPRHPPWHSVQSPTGQAPDFGACPNLDAGEAQAVWLALSLDGIPLVADDRNARTCGRRLGLPIIGTLGVIVRAKRAGQVAEATPLFRQLAASSCFMDEALVRRLLGLAGEDSDAFFHS